MGILAEITLMEPRTSLHGRRLERPHRLLFLTIAHFNEFCKFFISQHALYHNFVKLSGMGRG